MTETSPYPGGLIHRSWLDVLADPVRLGILLCLAEVGHATRAQLTERNHVSDRTLRRHLETLVVQGLIREHAPRGDSLAPGRPAKRFALEPSARRPAQALLRLLREPLPPWPRQTRWPPPDR